MGRKKNSHLRSLMPAVMVGLVALAANQYFKMTPRSFSESLASLQPKLVGLKKVAAKPVSPLAMQQSTFESVNEIVAKEFSTWQKQRHPVNSAKLTAVVIEADHVFALLSENDTLKPEDQRRACLSHLVLHFMAAQMQPEIHSDSFLKICTEVVQDRSLEDLDRVQALRFYHELDFSQADSSLVLPALVEFSATHNEQASVALYQLVAEELVLRGKRELAIELLKQGIQHYSGSAVGSKLVNALVDIERLR
ncbi:MAG: hypothetical protein GY768_27485 [Planctomycetaceae bacterium]|nr:hypothetical protein [Planctomycetaceae bacterium]